MRHKKHLASLAKGDSIFAGSAETKLVRLRDELAPLAVRYDVVVANPPYMGSSSLNRWEGAWLKRRYPEEYRDLCTCFIERGFAFCKDYGSNAMVTMQSWMFLGSYERMRGKLLANRSIVSMAHLGTRAFGAIAGEVVSTAATVFGNASSVVPGTYFRLVDMGSEEEKRAGLLEALADPECGWFYSCSTSLFTMIPGSPIAYWISDGIRNAFEFGVPLSSYVEMPYGFKTGDNERFLRLWWECNVSETAFGIRSDSESIESGLTWFLYNKGGSFRKWYGNNDYVLNYYNAGSDVLGNAKADNRSAADYNHSLFFKPVVSWSRISSGRLHMRFSPFGSICDMTGSGFFGTENALEYLQAFCNSTTAYEVARILSPTLDYQPGQIGKYPVIGLADNASRIHPIIRKLRSLSEDDWNNDETAWDFTRHPAI